MPHPALQGRRAWPLAPRPGATGATGWRFRVPAWIAPGPPVPSGPASRSRCRQGPAGRADGPIAQAGR